MEARSFNVELNRFRDQGAPHPSFGQPRHTDADRERPRPRSTALAQILLERAPVGPQVVEQSSVAEAERSAAGIAMFAPARPRETGNFRGARCVCTWYGEV